MPVRCCCNTTAPQCCSQPCLWSHTQPAHRRVRALEAAVRKLDAAQREQLPVPRFWAVSAASFAVAAAVLGGVALLALGYGRRTRPAAAASAASAAPMVVRPM